MLGVAHRKNNFLQIKMEKYGIKAHMCIVYVTCIWDDVEPGNNNVGGVQEFDEKINMSFQLI